MKRSRVSNRHYPVLAWGILPTALLIILVVLPLSPSTALSQSAALDAVLDHVQAIRASRTATDEVKAAWQRAREAGSYEFTTDLVQKTIPLPLITNVGRASKEERLHLEGAANPSNQQMHLVLWSRGGSVLNFDSGVEVKVDGDQAFVRQGDGEWQENDSFTQLFAPDGDFMTFLAAAKDITIQGTEIRYLPFSPQGEIAFTRYTFRVDGRSFAAHLRDQLQQHLTEKGELPPGVTLELPRVYADMTGTGELWVDADGLPLRQIIHLQLLPQSDYRMEAEITTDFFNYGGAIQATADAGEGANENAAPVGSMRPSSSRVLQQALLAGTMLGFLSVLVSHRRSKKIYAAVVLAVITSLLVTPLLQSHHVAAFYERQVARTQEQEERQQESEMMKTLRTLQDVQADTTTLADHTTLEMIRNDDGTDGDYDGLTDVQELLLESDPLAADSQPNHGLDVVPSPGVPIAMMENGTDSDGDGLTDYEESLLGTSSSTEDADFDDIADGVDTDGDAITDTLEVEGFTYNSQTWYTDPLEPDTNDDGIEDGSEWYNADTHPTWDTDTDGTPDLFDRDNDGDGVPDNVDLSPFQFGRGGGTTPTIYNKAYPFQLIINGLKPNHPTYVEFQLRPTNPDHLWYAFNVLDWPKGDTAGQIHDVDDKTLFDVCQAQGGDNCRLTPDDNGDMRLVPMLEITFDGSEAVSNLPPQDTLKDDYGVSLQELDWSGTKQVAYVPLQLTTDPKSDDTNVAFYGKMLYHPAAAWGKAQSVRLAWAIQMLVDECGYPASPPAEYPSGTPWPPDPDNPPPDHSGLWPSAEWQLYEGGQCQFYKNHNQVQVVQTYYEDWYLTGLNVRENAGVDLAIIFEDPDIDAELLYDSALVQLAKGLEETLLVERDCEIVVNGECRGDGQRDLYVATKPGNQTLAERFDHTQNGGVSDLRRWGIANILRVETHSYSHLDEAYAATAKVTTKSILDTHFSPHWQASSPITPTMVFAREDRFRASNLDLQGSGSTAIQYHDYDGDGIANQLTLNLNADGGTPQQTLVGINLAPYRYDQAQASWESYPIEEYWDELAHLYEGFTDPSDSPDVSAGKLLLLQFFFLTLYHGIHRTVKLNGVCMTRNLPKMGDDDIQDWFSYAPTGGAAVKFVVNQIMLFRLYSKYLVVTDMLGKLSRGAWISLKDIGVKDILRTLKQYLTGSKAMRGLTIGGLVAGLLYGATIAIFKLVLAERHKAFGVAATFMIAAAMMAAAVLPIMQASTTIQTIRGMTGISRSTARVAVLGGRSEMIGATREASVVGLIITLAIIIAVFIYSWVTSDVEWGSVAANTLIADAISNIVITLVLFVIGLTVVGAIALAIIGVIDLILLGICEAGVDVLCGIGFVTIWTEGLARLIYSGGVTIDTERDNMVKVRSLDTDLSQPDLGLSAGNNLVVSSLIQTVVYQKPPSSEFSMALQYRGSLFGPKPLRATTFNYQLATAAASVSAGRNEHPNDWLDVQRFMTLDYVLFEIDYYAGWKRDNVSVNTPLQAGINHSFPIYLNTGMALPSYECWMAVCDTDETLYYTTSSQLGEAMIYDIFPATLDEFYTVAAKSGGYALAWGQSGSLTFPALKDADGDGLLNTASGGADPDDSTWDADGDGLSDAAELEFGSNPHLADSDSDNLTDLEEFFLATYPNDTDSDDDGLSDREEVDGWLFEYATGKFTRVTSNPGDRDTDHDGLSDELEKNLGAPYHPGVVNQNPVALYAYTSDADDVIRSGDSFTYTATVRNELPQYWWADGRLTMNAPGTLGSVTAVGGFELFRGQEAIIVQRTLAAQTGIGSQVATIANTVDASVLDLFLTTEMGTVNYVDELGITIDNDRPTSQLIGSGFVAAGGTRVLGINASDPTSYVSRVQVKIDNGSWFDATRQGSFWVFEWDVPTDEGEHTIYARATDAAGWDQATDSMFTVYVDANTPQVTTDIVEDTLFVVRRNQDDRWIVPTSGTATDPSVGPPASGIDTVHVRIYPNGESWQPATVLTDTTPNTWSLDYTLATFGTNGDGLVDPTGVYTVEVRARDRAGNETAPEDVITRRIRIDNTPPIASLETLAGITTISQTITIGGQITDTGVVTSGVAGLELALVPAEMVDAVKDPVLLLPLNEPPEAFLFEDQSGRDNDFICMPDQCPTSDVGGRFNTAAQFDGGDEYLDGLQIDVPSTDYSLALWFNTTCADCGIFSADHGNLAADGHDRDVFLDGGKVCANVLGDSGHETICTYEDTFADGNWHQVVHVVGSQVGGQQLFVDGELRVRGFLTESKFTAQSGLNVGFSLAADNPFFDGTIDEVAIYNDTLLPGQVAALYRGWQAALLAQPGQSSSGWQYTIPANTEGIYQIDLRGTDVLGNRNDERQTWRQWRGEIDTLTPRVGITVTHKGSGESATTTYTGFAEDMNLTEVDFEFPCELEASDRHYYDTEFWRTWSNDTTRLHRLTPSCTVAGFQTDDVIIRACDAHGHCAAATPPSYMAYATTCNDGGTGWCHGGDGVIGRLNLFGEVGQREWGGEILLEGLNGAKDIALDVDHGKMYWTDGRGGRIGRANLDGSNPEYVITGLSGNPWRVPIALDVDGNKMYWGSYREIWRANLDGSQAQRVRFVSGRAVYMNDLVVDSAAGKLYWTEGRSLYYPYAQEVWQANLDGTSAQKLFEKAGLHAMAIDLATDDFYWATYNRIYRTNLSDVSSDEELLRGDIHALTILPEINGLYWIGWWQLVSAQLDGTAAREIGWRWAPVPLEQGGQGVAVAIIPGQVITTTDLVLNMRDIPNLAVQGQSVTYELTIENRGLLDATNVSLQHTLPIGVGFASATPSAPTCTASGGTPAVVTCNLDEIVSGDTVTVTIGVDVYTDTTGTLTSYASVAADQGDHIPENNAATESTVATSPPSPQPYYMDNYLYFSLGCDRIERINLNITATWSSPEEIVTGGPVWLAVDPGARQIYWTDRQDHNIQRSDLDGSNTEDVIPIASSTRYIGSAKALAVDTVRDQVYWINWEEDTIRRANLDGSGVETVIPAGDAWSWRNSLAINTIAGELYWSEGMAGAIYRSDLNGKNIEAVVTGLDGPRSIDLDVFDNRIYWRTGSKMQRAYLDGSGIETILTVPAIWGYDRGSPILVDDLNGKLYWAGKGGAYGYIWQANLDGTDPITVTEGSPYGMINAYLPSPAYYDAYEPNEGFAEAADIGARPLIDGTLFPGGDVDYFSLPVLTGQRIFVDLYNLPDRAIAFGQSRP